MDSSTSTEGSSFDATQLQVQYREKRVPSAWFPEPTIGMTFGVPLLDSYGTACGARGNPSYFIVQEGDDKTMKPIAFGPSNNHDAVLLYQKTIVISSL